MKLSPKLKNLTQSWLASAGATNSQRSANPTQCSSWPWHALMLLPSSPKPSTSAPRLSLHSNSHSAAAQLAKRWRPVFVTQLQLSNHKPDKWQVHSSHYSGHQRVPSLAQLTASLSSQQCLFQAPPCSAQVATNHDNNCRSTKLPQDQHKPQLTLTCTEDPRSSRPNTPGGQLQTKVPTQSAPQLIHSLAPEPC